MTQLGPQSSGRRQRCVQEETSGEEGKVRARQPGKSELLGFLGLSQHTL